MSFASLFADNPPPATGNGNGAKPPTVAGKVKSRTIPRTFIQADGLQIPDLGTVKAMAQVIEEKHPKLRIQLMHDLGHHIYPYGAWVIRRWDSGKDDWRELLRYADNLQLQEIYEALDDDEKFWRLANGDNMAGPYRTGKPPISAKGRPLIEDEPDMGGHGPLRDECEWIESHDAVFVRYAGTEPLQWPTGCWVIQKAGCDDQLLNAEGVKYVAHKILGMPNDYQPRKKRPTKTPDRGLALRSLFADTTTERTTAERQQPTGIGAIFTDEPAQPASLGSLFM